MRVLSLVSGWYPHYLVVEKAYHAVLKYYIERPDDRLGPLKGISSPSESLELRRQVL